MKKTSVVNLDKLLEDFSHIEMEVQLFRPSNYSMWVKVLFGFPQCLLQKEPTVFPDSQFSSYNIYKELGRILQTRDFIWNLNNFLQKISELHGKNSLLNLQLDKTNKLLILCQSQEETAKKECAVLQNVIKGLQQIIENQYNLRDENEKLKKTAQILEEKLKTLEEEHKDVIDKLITEIESKEKEYNLQQKRLHCEVNKKIEMKVEEHNQLIEKKELEIVELTRQLKAQEKEKENEIIKLQIEFNTKLARLQTKTLNLYPSPTALPQSIYRRKLQHFQEEKNKEIEFLRNTIKDLEQRLGKSQDRHFKLQQF